VRLVKGRDRAAAQLQVRRQTCRRAPKGSCIQQQTSERRTEVRLVQGRDRVVAQLQVRRQTCRRAPKGTCIQQQTSERRTEVRLVGGRDRVAAQLQVRRQKCLGGHPRAPAYNNKRVNDEQRCALYGYAALFLWILPGATSGSRTESTCTRGERGNSRAAVGFESTLRRLRRLVLLLSLAGC